MLRLAVLPAAALLLGQAAVPTVLDGPGFIEIRHTGAQDQVVHLVVIARRGNTLFYKKNIGPDIDELVYRYDSNDAMTDRLVSVVEVDDSAFAEARRITQTTACATPRELTGVPGDTEATVRVPASKIAYRCTMTPAMACTYAANLHSALGARGVSTAGVDFYGLQIGCDNPR